MKKILTLIIAFCIGLSFSYAGNDESPEGLLTTTEMTGKVVDKLSGETLAGVMVELDGTGKSVFSDFDGNFTFENLIPGEYKLILSLISYEKNETKIDLSKPTEGAHKVMLQTIN